MISRATNLSPRLKAANRVLSGDPWIPNLQRKRRDGNPHAPFDRPGRPTRLTIQILCHSCSKGNPKDMLRTTPPTTLLTEVLRIDSIYEAATPPRLDLVMRQHGCRRHATCRHTPGIVWSYTRAKVGRPVIEVVQ